ncbi:choline dehydrogenase [Halomonas sp. S2151]|uniref:GMC family oxidoreductase n=1 Tax=unclassified Halomonas TaxID=2609666 RepID=UPI0005F9E200|nr:MULTISPECIES: choline dehydrogenase [unclassified Halomonas]KJZ16985.1 choline dehydrogenase [Halomonas sp. S2151]MAR74227.1 choline dehydrogenase [Halomonas sp.]MBS8268643.1 choline dehydrogenase [Halomonas litopenaei]RQW72577.1 choline dehydrogenase [Halomonas sp. YLB-10]
MTTTTPPPEAFDYIIVGAGSAGCVLANRLSEDPEVSVLLLEAGGSDWNPWIHVPVGYFKTMHNPATDWCYLTDPDEGIDGRRLQWPRGKVLGGSSSLNGLLYIRGQREDYDDWAQLGNDGWDYDSVLPYFKKSECQERGADDYHGADGPLKVSDLRLRREIAERFIEAAKASGIPENRDVNGARQEGVGYFQQTSYKGFRCSTAKAFLRPALKRPNLTLVKRAHCQRLLLEGKRVVGVEYRQGQSTHRASARLEVLLSSGAIGSPQILQCSGIGDPDHLAEVGVDCRHALPGVGENLQDHLQIRLVFKTSCRTLNDEVRHPLRKLAVGTQYALTRTGPLTLAASQVCIFTQSREGLDRPDIQFHMQPLSADKPAEGVHPFSAFTSSVCQLRPTSRGRIRITSADPAVYPSIQPNYLSTEEDCRVAVDAIKVARRIAEQAPLAEVITDEYVPGREYQSDEQLLEAARRYSQTIYHPAGTCKMGHDDLAVVDDRLRVHGLEGLRVVDASIMPIIVSGNTNAPTIMIAERAADMIKADRRAQARVA